MFILLLSLNTATMARRVFYSFHYKDDSWRVSKIRNIGAIEDNQPAKDNDWESIRGDYAKVQRWIQGQLKGRSCTVVLIGTKTAQRRAVQYEIKESWRKGMGVLGIHIHNITDHAGNTCEKGSSPFDGLTVDGITLGKVIETYDPWGLFWDSKDYRNYIARNIEGWIEDAIRTRGKY